MPVRPHQASSTQSSSTQSRVGASSGLRRVPSITMPGSLFPRTSSLQPDDDGDGDGDDNDGHLRSPTKPSGEGSVGLASMKGAGLGAHVSPWRTRPVASVHDAVQRFNVTDGGEADFSLQIPSPRSPAHAGLSPQIPSSSRECMAEEDDDLLYVLGAKPDVARIPDKAHELHGAGNEQCEVQTSFDGRSDGRTAEEREHDKQRIKSLEAEIKRLQDEVCRRVSLLGNPLMFMSSSALQEPATISRSAPFCTSPSASSSPTATSFYSHRSFVLVHRSTVCKRACLSSSYFSPCRNVYQLTTRPKQNEEMWPGHREPFRGTHDSIPR